MKFGHAGGNPPHESGYRTGYFWEDGLQFESFLDILGHFVLLEKKEEKIDNGKGGARRRRQWFSRGTISSIPFVT